MMYAFGRKWTCLLTTQSGHPPALKPESCIMNFEMLFSQMTGGMILQKLTYNQEWTEPL